MNGAVSSPTSISLLAVLTLSLGLSACATSGEPCAYDFRQQGFIGAAAGAAGQYQRCTDHLIAQLQELQLQVNEAKANAERLEALAAQSSASERQAAQRLADVNRESQAALDDLNRLRRQNTDDRQRLDQLIDQQRALETQKNTVSDQVLAGGEAAQLEAEIAALQRQQAALRETINAEIQS